MKKLLLMSVLFVLIAGMSFGQTNTLSTGQNTDNVSQKDLNLSPASETNNYQASPVKSSIAPVSETCTVNIGVLSTQSGNSNPNPATKTNTSVESVVKPVDVKQIISKNKDKTTQKPRQ